ncbi:MAG TPA: DUF1801 domain-containing protein [Candidatus Limnocylindrales bacterium]|jgi:hypothetical protein|nr:DUF1801 domain-containing protein [Candidatus Limnocylindrales bacterium]
MELVPTTAFLDPYPPHIREIAERLRSIVLGEEPDAIERVRSGWRLIGYDLPVGRRTVYFAFVAPEPVHVHLGFEHGIFMNDPDRRMRGAHLNLRKVRYLTLRSMDDVDDAAFRGLVREAARIARLSRDERLAIAADREARAETR